MTNILQELQTAVSYIEKQITEAGRIQHGQLEGEDWQILLIAVALKDGVAQLHAMSNVDADVATYIAARFAAEARNHERPITDAPPKVV